MTEQELRRRVCEQAAAWLGRKEADGSHREIIDRYNRITPLPRGYRMGYDDPWCAAFVSAVGAALGLTATLLPECGCEPMIALYQAAGRFEEDDGYLPAPGDLVFYDWQDDGRGDCRGAADHVGLVTETAGESLTVIEGNCADRVARRRISRDARFLRGFARPDYASAAEGSASSADAADGLPLEGKVPPQGADEVSPASAAEGPASSADAADGLPLEGKVPPQGADEVSPASAKGETPHPSASPQGKTINVPLPLLRRGDTGPAVEAAQVLLIARGFTCGPWGADGDFGAATFGAVYRFQQARGLRADGAIGPETWPALIGAAGPAPAP